MQQATTDRFNIALTFAFVGPFIGAMAMFVAAVATASTTNAGVNPGSIAQALFLFLMLGYAVGIGPAAIAGVAYAFLPGMLQRLVLAPADGAVAVWAFYQIAGRVNSNLLAMSNQGALIAVGAIAALGCAWIVRRSDWTPRHGEGSANGRTENAEN